MLVFAIIYAILFAGLAWKKLNWAILLLLGFLPSYLFRFNLAGIPFTVLELMILIITLVWLIQNRKDLKNLITEIRQNKFYWPIVAFFADCRRQYHNQKGN